MMRILLKPIPFFSLVALLLASATEAREANKFFAMDTAISDAKHRTRESQVKMVAELGYDGISLGPGNIVDLKETLRLLDAKKLKLYAIYLTVSVDAEQIPGNLVEAMTVLKGRGTCLWLAVNSSSSRFSSPIGDLPAVPYLREIADLAAKNKLRVALYPHAGSWIERVEDGLRVAEKINRPNVGVTFNLCHWLKVSPNQDLVTIIRKAAPLLTMLSINGADRGGKDWKQLIQRLDRGNYDVGKVMAALKDVGYKGPVGFQGFGIGGDAQANLAGTMDAWRKLTPAAPSWEGELLGTDLMKEIASYKAGGSRKAFTVLEERLRDALPEGRDIIQGKLLDMLASKKTTRDAKCRLIGLLGRWGNVGAKYSTSSVHTERTRSRFIPFRKRQAPANTAKTDGGSRLVSALASLMDESATFHAALGALSSLSGPESEGELRAALGRLKGKELVGVINVVGERGDTQAVGKLAALAGSPDTAVACAAVGALGSMGSETALAALEEIRLPKEFAVARTHARLACANRLLAGSARQKAQRVFEDVYANGGTTALRVAALDGLARLDNAEAVKSVIAALDSKNGGICLAAAGLLVKLSGSEVARIAGERLPSLHEDAQIVLLAGLEQRGDRGAADAVAKLAMDGTNAVDLVAIRALGGLGGPTHVALLEQRMLEEGEAGKLSRESLCRLDAPGVGPAILARLSGGQVTNRCEMMGVVADRGMSEAVPSLIGAVRKGGDEERSAALRALRALVTNEHLDDLVDLLPVEMTESDRSRLTAAMKAIVAKAGVTDKQIERLIAVLNKIDSTTKPVVIEVLGRSGTDRAFGAIKESLDSKVVEVRKAAIRALSDWPTTKPLPLLRDTARDDPDMVTGVLAFRGYVDMLARDFSPGNDRVLPKLEAAAEFARRPEDKQFVLQKVKNLQNAVKEIGGCICTWELAGPYTGGNRQSLFNTAFPPEKDGNTEVEWRSIDTLAGPFTKLLRPGDINLTAIVGGNNRVAYLRTRVFSTTERDAVLELGSDDGIKAWLNGEAIWSNDIVTAHKRGRDKVNVRLRKGTNDLMLKIIQLGGEWGASARVVEKP